MTMRVTRVSPLHTKGLLTMAFWVFSESVSLSHALKLSRTDHRFAQPPPGKKSENGFSENTNLLQRIVRRAMLPAQQNDCCRIDCSGCVNPIKARLLFRGGHMDHVHGVAAKAASSSVTPYNIPLNLWKVIMQIFLTAINVLCWLIPLRSKRIQNKLALSLANAFSGGVFLSLAFGHLIPECLHGFHDDWPETTPHLLVLTGYLLIFFVEKVAFDAHDIMHGMQQQNHNNHLAAGDHRHQHHHHQQQQHTAVNNGDPHQVVVKNTGRSALILLAALGVHSILEMMALGLADSFADSALLTLSISLHQPAESIALLVAFLKSGMPEAQIITYLSIFSCMGPIGVAAGMAVNEFAAPIVDSIFLAIVAGTFVYVGATEVIPEEWEDSSHKWKKFAALMSGIVSILAVTQYTSQFHGH